MDRQGYIGGSDAAIVAGLSPWKSNYQLWLEKRGVSEPDDLSDNERVKWGERLEAIVAEEYSIQTGKKIRRVNRLIQDREYPFIAAHIDRDVLNEPRILEVKTTARAQDWGEQGTDEIPEYYMPQVQHYLMVTGNEICDVAVLIGGNQFRIYSVPRDELLIKALRKLEVDFWNRVQSGQAPDPETSAEADLAFPVSQPGTVQATDEQYLIAQELSLLNETLAGAKDEKDRLETALKLAMADIGDTLMYKGQKLATWKLQTRTTLDTKAMRDAMDPELLDEFEREKSYRVFRAVRL